MHAELDALTNLAPFTAEEARAHVDQTKVVLRSAFARLTEERLRGADVALGYPTWHEFVEAEYGDLREQRLPEAEEVALFASMRRSKMSLRKIEAKTGRSTGTIRARLAQVDPATLPSTVVSGDGRERPAVAPRPTPPAPVAPPAPLVLVRKTDRAVQLIAAAGAAGLTVKAIKKATGWEHQEASPTLTRLVKAERIAYRAPEKRGQFGVYVLPELL